MPGPFVFISHGRIKAGKAEDFKAYAERFLSGVEERGPHAGQRPLVHVQRRAPLNHHVHDDHLLVN